MPKLTKRAVDTVAPTERDVWLWDVEVKGFGLRVWPSGRKVFMFVYRPAGGGRATSKRKVAIGTYGEITVEQARTEAKRLAGEVAAGRCPASERDTTRAGRRAAREAPTLADLVKQFLADRRARKKASTVDEYERFLNRDVVPALGRHKVASVTRTQIAALHRGMADRPYLANRVLAVLHAAFAFAELHEMRPRGSNPCAGVEAYTETGRERFLTQSEFAAVGAALTRAERQGLPTPSKLRRKPPRAETAKHRPKSADAPHPANPFAVAAIRFLLLSGWREREALSLRWEYLDEERGTATLPTTKTGRSVRHLGAAAWQLLEELPRLKLPDGSDSPYVFPSDRKPGEPLNEIKRVWEAVRHAANLPTVRLHDLRHSYASVGAGDLGLSLPTLGALLGHTEVATTQRYAHLADDPRKRAADAISEHVAALLKREQASDSPDRSVLRFPRRA